MASVMDTIYISLGLKTDDFKKSMDAAKENIEKTSQSLSKGADQTSAKAFSQLANVARMVAAPLAGALSIGSMIKTYFSGVAQVAQMTGAYSTKLEEWRKKRALLNRVTKEDIALYKKSREAITKFQIVMDDLGAKIARQTSPAIKFFVELLEKVAKWIDKYSNDIVRFLKLVAVVIGVALLPQLYKMAAALLMNPLVWLIGIIGFLLLALDDLIVYLKGGNSAFEKFWKFIGLTKGDTELLNSVLKGLVFLLTKVVAPITAIMLSKYAFKGLTSGALAFVQILKNMASGLASVVVFFGHLAKAIMLCTVNMIRLGVAALANPLTWIILAIVAAVALLVAGIWALWKYWDQISAWISEKCEQISNWFKDIGKSIKEWFEDKILNVKKIWEDFCKSIENWYNTIIGWFKDIGKAIKEAFSFDNISKKLDGVMKKFNPANWSIFGGGDEGMTATAESAERAVTAQTMGGSNNTMYNSPNITLNNPSPSAVREAFTQSGASAENYGDYIAQMARSGT